MKVYTLIKILANVCKYNAEGDLYVRQPDNSLLLLSECEDAFIDDKRILVFNSKPNLAIKENQ